MSDIIVDGRTTVWFVPTIASANGSPTVSELAGGHRISKWMIPTGLAGFETQQAEIDNSSLESANDTKLPGRKSYSGTSITLKEQTTTDTAYAAAIAAMAESTDGWIVIRDGLPAATTPVAAQPLESFQIRTGEHARLGRGENNSLLRRMIPTPVSGTVNKTAAVLA